MSSLKKIIQQNSFIGLIRLGKNLILTKLFFPSARIIRFPIFIKGRNGIHIGKNFTAGIGLRLDCEKFDLASNPRLFIGNNVEINDYVHIGCTHAVTIEDNVLIASKVFITDHNHGVYSGDNQHSSPDEPPKLRIVTGQPVYIEQNVWIGEMVTILPGVRIGRGSIIGANSVVSKTIPAFSIAVGTPAKVVKQFNFESKKWEI